jgi:hypothetical protein
MASTPKPLTRHWRASVAARGEGVYGLPRLSLFLFFCGFRDFLSRSGSMPEGAALVWMGVFHHTVDLPPFMIFWEIFRNR